MTRLPNLVPRLRTELTENILPFWMTHVPDRERGGFHGAISNTLEIDPDAPRAAILCARIFERIRPAVLGLAETVYREGRDSDGSLFYEGYAGQIHDDSKAWWPQAEALVGFTNAFQLTGDPKFAAAVSDVWRFIENYLIDRTHGDWFKQTDRAGTLDSTRMKAGIWDCPYHHSRACFELMERLSEEK